LKYRAITLFLLFSLLIILKKAVISSTFVSF
jgi:hypothetical protein